MTEEFEYPFPVREEPATIVSRLQIMLLVWAVVNDKKSPPLTFKQKFNGLWVTFKYYYLTRNPKVAYRAD